MSTAEQRLYYLMHRDHPVCTVTIDMLSGQILRATEPKDRDLLPPGGNMDVEALRNWWHRRAVPVTQRNIRQILDRLGLSNSQEYLTQNLGLSLSDHYWIRPLESDLTWKDVNLFTNDFNETDESATWTVHSDGISASMGYSPSSSTQGDLEKKWIIRDGRRYLVKANHGSNSQESLNEVFATKMHQLQQKQPFTVYQALRSGHQFHCICECFTSDRLELIPAADLIHSEKKNNSVSVYEHLIQVCVRHGLPEETVRSFLEYQIMTDFLITNTDRHLNNFGALRDTETLRLVGMAPIFDSGHAMFLNDPWVALESDLTEIAVNSILKTEARMLACIRNRSRVDLSRLPEEADFLRIYQQDSLIPRLDLLWMGYRKKIRLLTGWMETGKLDQSMA